MDERRIIAHRQGSQSPINTLAGTGAALQLGGRATLEVGLNAHAVLAARQQTALTPWVPCLQPVSVRPFFPGLDCLQGGSVEAGWPSPIAPLPCSSVLSRGTCTAAPHPTTTHTPCGPPAGRCWRLTDPTVWSTLEWACPRQAAKGGQTRGGHTCAAANAGPRSMAWGRACAKGGEGRRRRAHTQRLWAHLAGRLLAVLWAPPAGCSVCVRGAQQGPHPAGTPRLLHAAGCGRDGGHPLAPEPAHQVCYPEHRGKQGALGAGVLGLGALGRSGCGTGGGPA